MSSRDNEFALWEPFLGIRPADNLVNHLTSLVHALSTPAPPSLEIFNLVTDTFLKTYGAERIGESSESWMQSEFLTIFKEATKPPKSASDDKETGPRFFNVNPLCTHSDTCLCFLSVQPNAGIPNFPKEFIHLGGVRKNNIERMQRLLVQFLILFSHAGKHALNSNEIDLLKQLIGYTDPNERMYLQSSAFTDVEDDRRSRYIDIDSDLQHLTAENHQSISPQNGADGKKPSFVFALCAVVGRRILVLSVAFKGLGYLFAQRSAVQYWDFQSMLTDLTLGKLTTVENGKYLLSDARAAAEKKKYPLRVINTEMLEIETDAAVFKDNYAILSHTWSQNGEVLYKEIVELFDRAKRNRSDNTEHYTLPQKKLLAVIEKAKKLNYPYIWIDNCLINKEDIPELNESLPNMGDWYANASVCLIYLEDFTGASLQDGNAVKSRWATRGWTLQETVMSRRAIFFNKEWEQIGDTEIIHNQYHLAKISHVPQSMLCCGGPPNVAASLVLQLAATRKTFKPEDRAYSLLSMLRVRIPVDYGEGSTSAMSRLFSAILQTTGDVTIFNWSGKLLQSIGHGRSLYPIDYTAFQNVHPTQKPAFAQSPIRVDYVGIHARFDVFKFDEVTINYDNAAALEVVRKLQTLLKAGNRLGTEKEMVAVTAYGKVREGMVMGLDVLCPLNEVRLMLEKWKEWVLVRFAGLETADWWLCGMDKAYGGLEARGIRLATDELEQNDVPKDERMYRQIDMWVG